MFLLLLRSLGVRMFWMLIIGTTPVSTRRADYTNESSSLDDLLWRDFKLPLLSMSTLPLKLDIDRDEEIFQKRTTPMTTEDDLTPSPKYSSYIQKRMVKNQNSIIAMSELIHFLVTMTGRNVYIFYDCHHYPGISEALTSISMSLPGVTLLVCEEAIKQIENLLKTSKTLKDLRNIIVLCNSSQTLQLFEKIHRKYLESTTTQWVVILQENTYEEILPYVREGTQVSFATKEFNFKYQLYNSLFTTNKSVSSRYIGWWSWSTKEGSLHFINAPLTKPSEEVYSDFGGRQLIAAVIENWPFWHLETVEDGTVQPISGLDLRVLTDISEKLNFTFIVKVMPAGSGWGKVKPDGEVTGAIGEVHRHSADLAINEMILTENRELAVDFTYPYFLESKTLISPAPRKTLKEYAVFTPFPYEVWIMLVIVTLLIGPIIGMIVWIRRNCLEEINEKWDSISDVSFIMFKIMFQATTFPPKGLVFTLLFSSWYFFCLLVTSLYSNIMISTLVIPSYEKPIDSLWDLLDAIEHRGYKVIMNCKSNNRFIFGSTKQKIYRDIWKTFDHSMICLKGKDEIMDKVLTGKYVTVSNHMGGEVRVNVRGRERYHIARNEFYAHGYGIACPNGSPYREAFQRVILPLMWSGLVQKYTNDELRKARKTAFSKEGGPEAISLLHLQGGFFMFVFGNIGATAVLIAELFV